jgi:hypothetical protein
MIVSDSQDATLKNGLFERARSARVSAGIWMDSNKGIELRHQTGMRKAERVASAGRGEIFRPPTDHIHRFCL